MTAAQLKAAQTALTVAGFAHILSSMNDGGSDKFGLLYARGEETFWLNKLTINNLPI